MRTIIEETSDALVHQAADAIEAVVTVKPTAVLGIATGSTPEPLYAELTRRSEAGLNLSRLYVTCLDEYVGLPPGHPQSYHSYIRHRIIEPWGLNPERTVLPDTTLADPRAAAAAFESAIIALGGVDLQILGLGANGHIGFNEPGSPLDAPARVVELTEQTRRANARFFAAESDVPSRAITQGIGTIMRASRVQLLAFGAVKAPAVREMLQGPVTAELPASVLQNHPNATAYLDAAAAARLEGPPRR